MYKLLSDKLLEFYNQQFCFCVPSWTHLISPRSRLSCYWSFFSCHYHHHRHRQRAIRVHTFLFIRWKQSLLQKKWSISRSLSPVKYFLCLTENLCLAHLLLRLLPLWIHTSAHHQSASPGMSTTYQLQKNNSVRERVYVIMSVLPRKLSWIRNKFINHVLSLFLHDRACEMKVSHWLVSNSHKTGQAQHNGGLMLIAQV